LALGFTAQPFSASTDLDAQTGASASFHQPFRFDVEACWGFLSFLDRGELEACGGVAAGSMNAQGMGVTQPMASSTLIPEIQGGLAIGMPIAGGLRFRVEGLMIGRPSAPRFVFDGVDQPVFIVPNLGFRLSGAVEVRLE
jgi:hypothetical protein